ncbi:MAG: hypothetical protein KTR32_41335 [Granulosicoccus sp.]|nr:hypothetical protein [Granulosicoccus sp.]
MKLAITLILILSTVGVGLGTDRRDLLVYSGSPLSNPAYDFESAIEGIGLYSDWLDENLVDIPSGEYKIYREHLYYLLSSYVSGIYENEKTILPSVYDENISTVFRWSEKLGVFGGALLYESVKRSQDPSIEVVNVIPANFQLNLNGDMLQLQSQNKTWSVSFPYYFMIQNLGEIKKYKNEHSQIAVISTGASRDASDTGQSQATLIVLHADNEDIESFSNEFISLLKMGNSIKEIDLDSDFRTSKYSYDETLKMHKEVVFWSADSGSYGIAYLGIDGTYQNNRAHFIDFIRHFQYQ